MGRTSHKDDWARRRTQALFRLLRVQAPADFRASVLRRAQERPRPYLAPRAPLAPPRSACERYRSWLVAILSTTPRLRGLALGLGGAWVFILGLHLAWWSPQGRDSLPPGQRVIVAVTQPAEQLPSPGDLSDSVGQDKGALPEVTHGPALAKDMGPPTRLEPTDARATRGVPAAARAGMPPLVPPTPWAFDETLSNVRSTTPTAGPKRALAGKIKRSKKNQGPGKHAPA